MIKLLLPWETEGMAPTEQLNLREDTKSFWQLPRTLYSILALDVILIKIFIEQNQRYILFLL
jgi:hypothetical protein